MNKKINNINTDIHTVSSTIAQIEATVATISSSLNTTVTNNVIAAMQQIKPPQPTITTIVTINIVNSSNYYSMARIIRVRLEKMTTKQSLAVSTTWTLSMKQMAQTLPISNMQLRKNSSS